MHKQLFKVVKPVLARERNHFSTEKSAVFSTATVEDLTPSADLLVEQ